MTLFEAFAYFSICKLETFFTVLFFFIFSLNKLWVNFVWVKVNS